MITAEPDRLKTHFCFWKYTPANLTQKKVFIITELMLKSDYSKSEIEKHRNKPSQKSTSSIVFIKHAQSIVFLRSSLFARNQELERRPYQMWQVID